MAMLLAGCTPAVGTDTAAEVPPPWADVAWSAPGHTGKGFRDVARATNGARGGGAYWGGVDVFSLGLTVGVDDALVLGWSDRVLVDGPGPDLVVFENPFDAASGGRFMDPVVVEVSPDGERWLAFPHAFTGLDGREWSSDPADWVGFAGITPVLLHEEDNPVDPFDAPTAGGDQFDLAALPDDPLADEILADGVAAVRLTSAAVWTNPQTEDPYPRDPISNGADIDGVYGQHFAPTSR